MGDIDYTREEDKRKHHRPGERDSTMGWKLTQACSGEAEGINGSREGTRHGLGLVRDQ